MAELRLTGPTEDGHALRLAAPDGSEHLLPVSPDLHRLVVENGSAATTEAAPARIDVDPAPTPTPARIGSRPRPVRPVADQEDVRSAASQEAPPLPPREIQARLRAGASVEQVARESGNTYARIRSYGFPVLAERGWVAQQAQAVQIWVGGPDLYSSTVTDGGPSTLGELARHRLDELGVDTSALEWDAWRERSGSWTVTAAFPVTGRSGLPTREDPPARWAFRPHGSQLDPQNAWARILSDADAWDVFSGAPEQDAGAPADAASGTPAADTRTVSAGDRDDELLEVLRVRRGRRVGADAASDDALAHLLARGAVDAATSDSTPLEAAHRVPPPPENGDSAAPVTDPAPAASLEEPEPRSRAARLLRGLPTPAGDETQAPAQTRHPDIPHTVDTPDTPDALEALDAPAAPETPAAPSRAPRPDMPVPTPRPKARSASRRPSVPSWDEIVFGRKND